MKTIRISLVPHPSSVGRGIGFYAKFLEEALKQIPEVEITTDQPDLIHYTFFDLFYPTLTFQKNIPSVVSVHDVTPLVLSKLYPKGIRGRINLFRQKRALQKVDAIITDSLNSKSDIHEFLNIPLEKIHVIPLAGDPIYSNAISSEKLKKVKRKYNLPDQFVLYVGGINANKNLIRLIEVTQSLNLPLVLVGSEFTKSNTTTNSFKSRIGLQSVHPELQHSSQIKQLIEVSPNIQALGFVASENLAAIYRLATLYCQPSLYEGFGLPLLEAMMSDCLIVSSNTSSLSEIYPKGTITFDPSSTSSMVEALRTAISLTKTERSKLISAAAKRAKDFSWIKTAKETMNIYQQVLSRSD